MLLFCFPCTHESSVIKNPPGVWWQENVILSLDLSWLDFWSNAHSRITYIKITDVPTCTFLPFFPSTASSLVFWFSECKAYSSRARLLEIRLQETQVCSIRLHHWLKSTCSSVSISPVLIRCTIYRYGFHYFCSTSLCAYDCRDLEELMFSLPETVVSQPL